MCVDWLTGCPGKGFHRIMLAVHFDQPGGPENLYLKEVAKPEPGPGEVLLKVAASALNRADVLQRWGQYSPPPGASNILGLEASGHVVTVGPGCQGPWKAGHSAMALLAGGGQAEYVTVPEGHLMPVPKGLTLIQAAAIPEAWLTAFQLLHVIGQVKAGETVLIHAGSSGVGTAAVQLARQAGAIPLVTAGSLDKIKAVEKLGAAAGFNYKEGDFSAATLEFTKGAGANVILDCVGGSYWEKNVACLALDGRWVLYGLLGGAEVHGELLSKLLTKRGSLLTSLLRSRDKKTISGMGKVLGCGACLWSPRHRGPEATWARALPQNYKAELVAAFTQQILPHFAQDEPGSLRPVVDTVFPLKQVAEAHVYMEQNKNLGKIVLEVTPVP
uniref:Quinone oxidoreductase PIG3-like isoform X3 n=1 Tax=Phascolarctos cinereus TaxID=38626 RepID=A0A6P5JHC7_PHACI|nr:quinone oxidoreductase PIG3-like isoform X3 [Phascolarctos cinereus]